MITPTHDRSALSSFPGRTKTLAFPRPHTRKQPTPVKKKKKTTHARQNNPRPHKGNNTSNLHGKKYGNNYARESIQASSLTFAVAALRSRRGTQQRPAAATSSPSHPTTPTTTTASPTQVQPPRCPSTAAPTSSSPTQVRAFL